jgi:hypothetical protein
MDIIDLSIYDFMSNDFDNNYKEYLELINDLKHIIIKDIKIKFENPNDINNIHSLSNPHYPLNIDETGDIIIESKLIQLYKFYYSNENFIDIKETKKNYDMSVYKIITNIIFKNIYKIITKPCNEYNYINIRNKLIKPGCNYKSFINKLIYINNLKIQHDFNNFLKSKIDIHDDFNNSLKFKLDIQDDFNNSLKSKLEYQEKLINSLKSKLDIQDDFNNSLKFKLKYQYDFNNSLKSKLEYQYDMNNSFKSKLEYQEKIINSIKSKLDNFLILTLIFLIFIISIIFI